ncbi:Uncharacterised protein [Bordetella pertussis]|nr:Uncharacterised protein [Bordetella pertussis]
MSAPPMGMMINTPSANASTVMMTKGGQAWVAMNHRPQPSISKASARLSRCWPGNTTGAPWNNRNLYLPDSLPNAMTDPEKVMAPTKVPMNSSRRLPVGISPPAVAMPKACGSATTATAMATAARPIMLCMKATSSGILVISTRLAIRVPALPPISRPSSTQPRPGPAPSRASAMMSAAVVRTAMAMPTMPKVLPSRDVVGCDRPLSAWMKQTEAIR